METEILKSPTVKMVPELRFPKFFQEWENVFLENVAIRGSGHTPNKNHPNYYDGNIKWISLADSSRLDNGYIKESKNQISQAGLDNSSAVLHPEGTVILSRDAGVGKSAVLKSPMAVSQHFIVWKPKKHLLVNWFLYYILQILKPEFERIAIGSTIKTIGLPYFKKLKINIPSFPEQKKIASFLSAVDKKIQQLTRKKELLETYKKGVMQQLFSQEIRFKDEDGNNFPEWEKKSLGEIADRITLKNTEDKINFVLTNSATQGIISQNDYFDRDIANQNNLQGYYVVSKDDFVYNPRISVHAPVGPIKRNKIKEGVMSPLYSVFRFKDDNNLVFFEYYFETVEWHKYLNSVANFGARHDRMNISLYDFYLMPLPFPCENERQKIADFLFAVDKKIEAVSQQIERTQSFKKGLLQQMFV